MCYNVAQAIEAICGTKVTETRYDFFNNTPLTLTQL